MFDGLFENRNRVVSDLIKLGDYLGRSLRENVAIFKIDVEEQSVCYVTESNKVIAGTYVLGEKIALNNIVIEDIDDFANESKFDSVVDGKISSFVKNIYEDSHKKAKSSFDDLLYLWESRLKFKSIKQKLEEKKLRFNESSQIIESVEFQRFLEIAPELVQYLKLNKHKISQIAEIKNSIRLAQTVSEAFNAPKIDYDLLEELGTFEITDVANQSIYEMICKHELIKKELLEHKANFDTVWASNEKVQALAGLLYSEEPVILKALSEAIKEVPYLALASKKQLTETFRNALNINKVKDVSLSDIQQFSSYIFETKKPIKKEFINHLNERYGINIQNLKDPASFKGLINTQVVIFETLAKISPKKSVQREVLSTLAESLKSKNGVEAIDCNEVLQEVFMAAGYEDLLINESLNNFLDFQKIVKHLSQAIDVLNMIQGSAEIAKPQMGDQIAKQAMAPTPTPNIMSQGMEDDDVSNPIKNALTPDQAEEEPQVGAEEEDEIPEMPEEEPEMGAEEEGEDELEMEPSEEDLMSKMKELEDIIANIKSEIGDEDSLESDLGDDEDLGDEEEEIDAEQEELDDQEDEIEAEHEEAHEEEDEAEEEEDIVRKKQKSLEKKEDNLKRMK